MIEKRWLQPFRAARSGRFEGPDHGDKNSRHDVERSKVVPGMPRLFPDLVVYATGAAVLRARASSFSAVTIDGRNVKPDALYVAIRGEKLDGHEFVAQAVEAGATGIMVARGRGEAALVAAPNAAVFEVDDTLLALGRLARAYRMTLEAKVVALTGSVGKTSTKEMIAAILSAAVGGENVHKTSGNLNNHLGVPLTVLAIEPHHRFAVVEMGMSGLGEIAYLEAIARPDVALVTNVAGVHLEQLGSIERVGQANGEIFEGRAAAGHAFAVAPVGDAQLAQSLSRVPAALRRTFGGEGADVRVLSAAIEEGATYVNLALAAQTLDLKLGLFGVHQANNAAAAAAVAQCLGIDAAAIQRGLEEAHGEKHRMHLYQLAGRTIIDDCYNASPPSVIAALDALDAMHAEGKRRVAVLGDMLELGPGGAEAHAAMGRYAAGRVDTLVAFGPLSSHAADAARAALGTAVFHTDDPVVAARYAYDASGPGDALLVKASRGMKLERVLDALAVLASAEPS